MSELQYQLSTGAWVSAEDRKEEFLDLCVQHNQGINSHSDAVMKMMGTGATLRNDSADWYSKCRIFDVDAEAAKQRARDKQYAEHVSSQITCKYCGQRGTSGGYPFSTLPASMRTCDDCD